MRLSINRYSFMGGNFIYGQVVERPAMVTKCEHCGKETDRLVYDTYAGSDAKILCFECLVTVEGRSIDEPLWVMPTISEKAELPTPVEVYVPLIEPKVAPVEQAPVEPLPITPTVEPEVVRTAPASNDALEGHTVNPKIEHLQEVLQKIYKMTPEERQDRLARVELVPCAEPCSTVEPKPNTVQESVKSSFPEPKPETEPSEDVTAEPPIEIPALKCMENSPNNSDISPSTGVVDDVVDVTLEAKSDIKSDKPTAVRHRRRDPWAGYSRPEPTAVSEKVPEPDVPMPPRAIRATTKSARPAIPEHVRAAKLALQGNSCTYCQRFFGSAVEHDGEVIILKPQIEHFKPVAGKGKTDDANCNYACGVCNLLKRDYLFATVAELIDFLDREWVRKGYTDTQLFTEELATEELALAV
jgi:5-methylcytosine-specific restriction endonuclease McrA